MKIVSFPNGKYAIRKGSWLFGYRFKNIRCTSDVWSARHDKWFSECLGPLEIVKTVFNSQFKYGTIRNPSDDTLDLYCHIKSGNRYVFLGYANNTTNGENDGQKMVAYRPYGKDELCVRCEQEFNKNFVSLKDEQ